MADSVDPVADVVLWKGSAARHTLRLRSITGATDAVRSLFGESTEIGGERPHPLFSRSATHETNATRQRWLAWFESALDPSAAKRPLTLRYPWPAGDGRSSPAQSAPPLVLESIWVDEAVPDQADEPTLPVCGHLLLPRPANMELADKHAIRDGLHKVNNDLSIVSMVLEVISLKLRQSLDDDARQQLTDSADHALAAIRRSGQIISAIQGRLKRR